MNLQTIHKTKNTAAQTAAAHLQSSGKILADYRDSTITQRKSFSDTSGTGTIQLETKKQREERIKAERAKIAAEKKLQRANEFASVRAKKPKQVKKLKHDAERERYEFSREQLEEHGHESTHRNLFTRERRASLTEAELLDTINPSGEAIPRKGLTIPEFRDRFEALLDEDGTISAERMSDLLPEGKAVDFPPERGRDPEEEIRAGRKWEIPNPDGGKHTIWTHTNDPKQDEGPSSQGAIVRVLDSSDRYLSNVNHTVPKAIEDKKYDNDQTKAAYEKAVEEGTGYWTTYHKSRTESQHIPLVE